MTDSAVILRKLTTLREHVSRMRRRRPDEADEFRRDVDLQDAVGMSLLVAVQEALDIALHIAADEGWGIPASYAESFDQMADHGVIDRQLAEDLVAMAALRNRLAHGYGSVEMDRLYRELPIGTAALERFASAVAGLVKPA